MSSSFQNNARTDFSDNASTISMKTLGKILVGAGVTVVGAHYFADEISNFHQIADDVCDFVFSGTHLATKLGVASAAIGAVMWAGAAGGKKAAKPL